MCRLFFFAACINNWGLAEIDMVRALSQAKLGFESLIAHNELKHVARRKSTRVSQKNSPLVPSGPTLYSSTGSRGLDF